MDDTDARELRRALIRATVAILPLLVVLGVQWWIVTPEPERLVRLRRLGISKCSEGRWHHSWIRQQCLCSFWVDGTIDQRLQAGLAEARNFAQWTERAT